MKKTGLLLLLGVMILLLSGCWNRRELNTLGIQLGTAIDKRGNEFQVAVQVVEPSAVAAKKESGTYAPVVMYKTTAPTVFEAFRKLTEISPRKIYASHIRVLVLGESLAREGIGKVLDLLSRDSEPRTDFYIMVARDTEAEQILKILTPLEKIPSNKLYASLEASSRAWAPTTTFTLDQLINELVGPGINPVLSGIEVLGDPQQGEKKQNVEQILPAARLRFSNLAVFKRDKLVGWLSEDESKGYNYIMDNVKSTVGHVKCPDGGNVVIETLRTNSKIKVVMEEGQPVIEIVMKNQSSVGEVECKINLEDPETIRMLETKTEDIITERMKKAVSVTQTKFKSDIFGFGQAIYRSEPKTWKRLQADWSEHFTHLKVRYKVDVIIRKLGTVGNSFLNDIKE
ncbi:Ger(x)C family spore germination protein [Paenibacillus sp. NPDC056579]|uniref:Ger(x)C family spore germination protein n=1 Tax=unclassified Paenibacillus TaxID=185978 RepID=UPI001EF80EA9|nr:Ger(x)C family spore germination protein [Paenibacillus sp. H1-7]ULL14045.1 Ger(x)C family spore germination protein [Paenibacillus sp. H1-7]